MDKTSNENDIRGKILRLIFKVAVLIFSIGGVFFLLSMIATWFFIDETSEKSGKEIAGYTRNAIEEDTIDSLRRITDMKVKLFNAELQSVSYDSRYIANELITILNSPQNYLPRRLPNISDGRNHLGEPYIYYTQELQINLTPEIENEIALVSNIADEMRTIYNTAYSDVDLELFIGFESGYMINLDQYADVKAYLKKLDKYYNGYDHRKRIWYEAAKKSGKVTFTDIYFSKGRKAVTCTMLIYHNEKFIGAIGIELGTDILDDLVVKTSVNSDVINFIMNKDGKIMMSSQKKGLFAESNEKDLRESEEKELSEIAKRMTAGETGVESIKMSGREYFLSYAPIEIANWSYGRLLIKKEVLSPAENVQNLVLAQMDELKSSVGRIFWIMIIISVVVVLFLVSKAIKYGKKLSDEFVKPIQKLTDGVREIASGNFDKKLNIQSGDEIEHLAICFNAMTSELKEYMTNLKQATAEKERSAAELEVAKNIQHSMLPRDFNFSRADFEIFASMEAAKEVGGDFYDFYLVDERHLVLTVADVSGKGIPAALFMVISKTMLKNFAQMIIGNDDLESLMTFTNQKLCESNDEMMFVTMFTGILDLKTGKFTYVNAGHNPPLIYRKAEGKFEYLLTEKRNQVLGLMDNAEYEQEVLNLSSGDMIFIYTGGAAQSDDITMLAIKLKKTFS